MIPVRPGSGGHPPDVGDILVFFGTQFGVRAHIHTPDESRCDVFLHQFAEENGILIVVSFPGLKATRTFAPGQFAQFGGGRLQWCPFHPVAHFDDGTLVMQVPWLERAI